MTGDTWLSHKATWYESFGNSDRIYERTRGRYNPYPGLLINTEIDVYSILLLKILPTE